MATNTQQTVPRPNGRGVCSTLAPPLGGGSELYSSCVTGGHRGSRTPSPWWPTMLEDQGVVLISIKSPTRVHIKTTHTPPPHLPFLASKQPKWTRSDINRAWAWSCSGFHPVKGSCMNKVNGVCVCVGLGGWSLNKRTWVHLKTIVRIRLPQRGATSPEAHRGAWPRLQATSFLAWIAGSPFKLGIASKFAYYSTSHPICAIQPRELGARSLELTPGSSSLANISSTLSSKKAGSKVERKWNVPEDLLSFWGTSTRVFPLSKMNDFTQVFP